MDLLNQVISNYPSVDDVQEGARVNKVWQSLKFKEIVYSVSARDSQSFLVIENFKQKENGIISLYIPITELQQLLIFSYLCFLCYSLLHQVFLLLVMDYFKANLRHIILLVSITV